MVHQFNLRLMASSHHACRPVLSHCRRETSTVCRFHIQLLSHPYENGYRDFINDCKGFSETTHFNQPPFQTLPDASTEAIPTPGHPAPIAEHSEAVNRARVCLHATVYHSSHLERHDVTQRQSHGTQHLIHGTTYSGRQHK